mmetsp:Transcript_10066/g.18727  ORF Transcript_10066/g.18727 Transcript_10066/m.18727 type:complete len:269 (-) Transcript_10066:618-1424(-)
MLVGSSFVCVLQARVLVLEGLDAALCFGQLLLHVLQGHQCRRTAFRPLCLHLPWPHRGQDRPVAGLRCEPLVCGEGRAAGGAVKEDVILERIAFPGHSEGDWLNCRGLQLQTSHDLVDPGVHTPLRKKVEAFQWHRRLIAVHIIQVRIRICHLEVSDIAVSFGCNVEHPGARVEIRVQRSRALVHIERIHGAHLALAVGRNLSEIPHVDLPLCLGCEACRDDVVAFLRGAPKPLHLRGLCRLANRARSADLALSRVNDVKLLVLAGHS